MKRVYYPILTAILAGVMIVMANVMSAKAQGPGAPPATPIDSGLSVLLAIAGIYGVKKIIGKRHN